MFALAGAVIFGLLLVLELIDGDLGQLSDTITNSALLYAGLLCIALHMAGIATRARR